MQILAARRAHVAAALPGKIALFANGRERPLNYPANTYYFRGDSHFTYFFGVGPAGAAGVIAGDEAHIFIEPITVEDAVWSGPGESWEKIAADTEAVVHPYSELKAFLSKFPVSDIASLPCQDPAMLGEVTQMLGRRPDPFGNSLDKQLAEAVIALRLQADPPAAEEMRRSCRAAVQAHINGMRMTRPGLTENQIMAEMQRVGSSEGMHFSFNPIVTVSGEHLHQVKLGATLKEGDLLLADLGFEADTYWCSDITNTWPVSGRFTPEQRALYEIVWEAHQQAAAMLGIGVRYRDVHGKACRVIAEGLKNLGILTGSLEEILERNAQAMFFPHGIGHLMGLDVHDMEDLGDLAGYAPGRSRSELFGWKWLRLDRDLLKGMTVTIEPGIYFIPELLNNAEWRAKYEGSVDWEKAAHFSSAHGIRIERDYMVNETGAELLTPGLPNTPDEIEEIVGSGL